MSAFRDLKNRIDRSRLLVALAIGVISATLLGNLTLLGAAVIPKWQMYRQLSEQLLALQEQSRVRQQQGTQTAEQVQTEIDTMRQRLADKVTGYLSEEQAAEALDHLYSYARDSGAAIVSVQSSSAPQSSEEPAFYDVRGFHVTAQGPTDQLLAFVGLIEETAIPGFRITNVSLQAAGVLPRLDLDIRMYISPYAGEAAIQETTEEALQKALVQALESQYWPQAIGLLQRLLQDDPSDLILQMQIYSAHMDYGTESLAQGDAVTAAAQFEEALTLRPDDVEATTGLDAARQQLSQATPTPSSLEERLDTAWAADDWPQVIEILDQLRAPDPEAPRWTEKLYAAYVNNGYRLAAAGEYTDAKESFTRALHIRPNGGEALSGLQALTSLPGPPTVAPPQSP